MANFEHADLFEKLIDKTKKNEAIWQKTNRDSEFILKIHSGKITIDKWVADEDDEVVIDFAIYNPSGEKIEYDQFRFSSEPQEFNFLNRLYTAITKKYHKVEETIANIKKEIGSSAILGTPPTMPTSMPPQAEDDLPF